MSENVTRIVSLRFARSTRCARARSIAPAFATPFFAAAHIPQPPYSRPRARAPECSRLSSLCWPWRVPWFLLVTLGKFPRAPLALGPKKVPKKTDCHAQCQRNGYHRLAHLLPSVLWLLHLVGRRARPHGRVSGSAANQSERGVLHVLWQPGRLHA